MRDDLQGIGPRPGRSELGGSAGSSGSPASREQPSNGDINRFRQAFQSSPQGNGAANDTDAKTMPSGPFDLFRGLSAGAAQGLSTSLPLAPSESSEPLRQRLRDMVTRLMVGDGDQAPRSVRMSLDDAVMPGVDLAVYEEEGFWVAHFYCRVQESFVELAAPGPDMASRLADTLRRPCLWRIEGESLPAQGDWRRYANAEGDIPLAEYRAQPLKGVAG